MNISELFSTEERIRILKHILYRTGYLSVNKVANELGLSKGLVSKFFDMLVKERIAKKVDSKFSVQDSLNVKAIKILLNLAGFDPRLLKKYRFVRSAGLYGSFVKGENTEESDIDLWVLVEKAREEDLAKLTSELKRTYRNIKPLYLTREKLALLKREDAVFYYSVVFGSITVYGEKLEAI